MPSENLLEKVKELREITGVGFKDCKAAIDETNGNIEKSVELLRKKGIAKASKRMGRVASEGLVCISKKENNFSIIEINSETDFVAKNDEFINFSEEVAKIALESKGKMENILLSKMENKKSVNDNLIDLVTKIGEKITLRRSSFIESTNTINFSYIHGAQKENVGKLGVLVAIETNKTKKDIMLLGKHIAMQIASSSPLSINQNDLNKDLIEKEKEIIVEELKSSGKDTKIIDKIAVGKLKKFIDENTLMNQDWIMEPKKKVKDIIKEFAGKEKIEVKEFIRFKVGEGL